MPAIVSAPESMVRFAWIFFSVERALGRPRDLPRRLAACMPLSIR